jgi:hypothetical protein
MNITIHHEPPPVTGEHYNGIKYSGKQSFIRLLEEKGFAECWIWTNERGTFIGWKVPLG